MSKLRHVWPPLALTVLAWAVRLYNLTYHSLWFDEAMSVHWARSSVPRILEVSMNLVEDRLPPLYYLSLHYWRLLSGDGELAVRLLSVLLGTLLIPVVYRLVTDLFDRRVGLLSATLTALNPFLIWYSQEARMYALAVFLGTLGTWFFWLGVGGRLGRTRGSAPTAIRQNVGANTSVRLEPGLFEKYRILEALSGTRYWCAYGLSALAGLYTHLYTGLLLPAHALYLLLTPRRSRGAWLPFALIVLAVALLFLPLGFATWRVSGEAGPGDPLTGFWARGWWLLSAFSVWKAPLSPILSSIITIVVAGFALAGLLIPYRPIPLPSGPSRLRQAARPQLLVALLLIIPPAIATLLLFRNQVAFFGERYFIIIVPWLMIAVATGAVNLADRQRAVLGISSLRMRPNSLLPAFCYLLPVALTLLPLPGQWSPPARKEAWRETVDYLATHAHPQDAILIHPDWTRYPLQYYFQGPGQTYAVFGSVQDSSDLDGPLTVIGNAHPVIWLVESHTELADPDHQADAWLAARYPAVTDLYPPGLVAVRAYAPGYLSDGLPGSATPLSLGFEGGLRLAGYAVPQARVQAADDVFHPPSGWVHVTLYWTAESPLAQNYAPFVHLVDDLGQVYGVSLERSNDAFNFYPPTRWEPDQVVRSDFDVNLNPITPPGRYTLVVGLREASGTQVPTADGSPQAPLTTVEIVR